VLACVCGVAVYVLVWVCLLYVCGVSGLSNERAVGCVSYCLTWGVWLLVWCCGLQQEGPLVLYSEERSGRGGGCHRVSADMWCGACGRGVLQSVGVGEATGGVAGCTHVCVWDVR
jgi:hypothetical protein